MHWLSKFLAEIYNKHNLKIYFHVHKKLAWIFSLFSLNSEKSFFLPWWFLLLLMWSYQFNSVAQSCTTLCNPMQHTRLPYPSPTPGACSNLSSSSQWCHPTILSSVFPFSCLQSFSKSESFPVSQFFASGGQSIGVWASTSVLPMNIQDWFPLELTGWISLQSKGLSRVFSNTTIQKHQFFDA